MGKPSHPVIPAIVLRVELWNKKYICLANECLNKPSEGALQGPVEALILVA